MNGEIRSLLKGDVPTEIKKLKQQDGHDLKVYGSANLIQTLMKHDLIDEFWLKIYPITLGMGQRLFAEGTIPAAFTVHESGDLAKWNDYCCLQARRRSQNWIVMIKNIFKA